MDALPPSTSVPSEVEPWPAASSSHRATTRLLESSGTALLEVLVASLLGLVLGLVVIQSLVAGAGDTLLADRTSQAAAIARSRVDELLATKGTHPDLEAEGEGPVEVHHSWSRQKALWLPADQVDATDEVWRRITRTSFFAAASDPSFEESLAVGPSESEPRLLRIDVDVRHAPGGTNSPAPIRLTQVLER